MFPCIEKSLRTTARNRISIAARSQKFEILAKDQGKKHRSHQSPLQRADAWPDHQEYSKLSQHQSAKPLIERSLDRESTFIFEARARKEARKEAKKGAESRAYRYSDHERGNHISLLMQVCYETPHHGVYSVQSAHRVALAEVALYIIWTELHGIQEYDMTQNMAAKIERDQLHGIDSGQEQLAIGAENIAVHVMLLHELAMTRRV